MEAMINLFEMAAPEESFRYVVFPDEPLPKERFVSGVEFLIQKHMLLYAAVEEEGNRAVIVSRTMEVEKEGIQISAAGGEPFSVTIKKAPRQLSPDQQLEELNQLWRTALEGSGEGRTKIISYYNPGYPQLKVRDCVQSGVIRMGGRQYIHVFPLRQLISTKDRETAKPYGLRYELKADPKLMCTMMGENQLVVSPDRALHELNRISSLIGKMTSMYPSPKSVQMMGSQPFTARFGQNKRFILQRIGAWDHRLGVYGMERGAVLRNWVLFVPERNMVANFVSTLREFGAIYGLAVKYPSKTVSLEGEEASAVPALIQRKWRELGEGGKQFDFVVAILPTKNEEIHYKVIHFFANVGVGLQLFQSENKQPARELPPYYVEDSLKRAIPVIAGKLGGMPWKLEFPPILTRRSMMVGLEKQSSNQLAGWTVLGAVSSIDESVMLYDSRIGFFKEGKLEGCLKWLLYLSEKKWRAELEGDRDRDQSAPLAEVIFFVLANSFTQRELSLVTKWTAELWNHIKITIVSVEPQGDLFLLTRDHERKLIFPQKGTILPSNQLRTPGTFLLYGGVDELPEGVTLPTQFTTVGHAREERIQQLAFLLQHANFYEMEASKLPTPLQLAVRLVTKYAKYFDNAPRSIAPFYCN